MNIELKAIKISDIFKDYSDNDEKGVKGFGGKLDIRPPYQREFIYKPEQRNAVIDTVFKGFPLNVMYWVKTGEDTYKVLDGQQRTLSICQYLLGAKGGFPYNGRYFGNLTSEEQEVINNYKLMIYICEGTEKEKLDWFKTINIAGEKLTDQELRNAVYHGTWLYDAKKYFSKRNCLAYQLAKDYLKGSAIRQDYLETAISWIADRDGTTVEDYMARHQHDEDADELWQYFQEVIGWVTRVFPNYRKEMKGLQWGILYNEYSNGQYNSSKFESRIKELMMDDEVSKKKGVYEYLLSGKEKYLNLRTFTDSMKREVYEKQEGVCPICKGKFDIEDMEGDHIVPWHEGGKTVVENCQMLCKKCNREKGGK